MKSIKNIFILLFTLILFLSISGVTIYQHHCIKCNINENSYFNQNFKECNIKSLKEVDNSCSKTEKECCSLDFKTTENVNYKVEDNCCFDEIKIFKISTIFLPTVNEINIESVLDDYFILAIDNLLSENFQKLFFAIKSPPLIYSYSNIFILIRQLIL